MAMTERVARLRQESLDAVPSISTERAELMTAFAVHEQQVSRYLCGARTRSAAPRPSAT